MHKQYLKLFLITIPIIISFVSEATNIKYVVIKDLSNDWQVYDKYYQSFIPLLTKESTIHRGGVFIPKNTSQNYFLSFYSNNGLSVFVENKLIYKHPTNAPSHRIWIPMKNIEKEVIQDPYLILFHNTSSPLYIDSLSLQGVLPKGGKESKGSIVQSILLRKNIFQRDVFIFSILIFCVVLVFYKFVFMKGRTLINIGLDRNTELLLLDRSGLMSITLIIINSLLYMMIYYVLVTEYAVFFNFPFRSFFQSETSSYILYLFSSFAIMQTLKIVYIKIINELTFPSGVSPLQNYLLLNYLFQTGIFVLPVLLLVIALFPSTYIIDIVGSATGLFFIILVIISVLTSYMIYVRSELRNIYLFSYICTAEIVPLIIAYRVLLG